MRRGLVLDASCAAAAILPDENGAYADAALAVAAAGDATVPDLFWHELANLLLMAERRRRLPEGRAQTEWDAIHDLPIETRVGPRGRSVLAFAREHALSAYDASYAVQALDVGVPLATLDSALIAVGQTDALVLWDET